MQGFLKTLHFFVLFARLFRVCRARIENWGKIGGRNGFEGAFAPLIFAFGIACAVKKGLYRAGGVFVTATQRVRVGLQRDGGVAVAQACGHSHGVYVVCQQDRGVCVPLRYNYDKPEKPRRIKGFEVFSLIFSSFSKPKNHTEISRIAGGVSLTTNE